jgi:excisionase family DNA binding protein
VTEQSVRPVGTGRTFDVKGAAAYLGVHPNTIQRWAQLGTLKGFRDRLHVGGPWRFIQGDLDALKQELRAPNT